MPPKIYIITQKVYESIKEKNTSYDSKFLAESMQGLLQVQAWVSTKWSRIN